jgi:hypothetical protein
MPSEANVAADTKTANDLARHEDLRVWVGTPANAEILLQEGLLLIVEADQEKALQLRRDLGQRQEAMVFIEVLAAQSGTPVTWFLFNAPRLNGPLAADHWQEIYPNLRQTGQQARVGRCLADLLNDFTQHQDLRQNPFLRLHLRQGDPLAALEGLGEWMAALQEVEVATPAAREVWAKPVDRWLTERGFRKADGTTTTWRRDPVATQQLLLEEKEQLISQLKDQVANQEGLLRESLTRNQELSGECEKLRVSLDDLTAEHLKVLSELDEQRERREALTLQIKRFDDELDKLLTKMAHDYGEMGGEDSPSLDSSLIENESGVGAQPDSLPRE